MFSDDKKTPEALPPEPVFIYENKRYLNFVPFDCFHLKNNDALRNTALTSIENNGIAAQGGRIVVLEDLQQAMTTTKKFESYIFFPDDFSVMFSAFSLFGAKTTIFIDYETSPALSAALQHRNIEYYDHKDLDQLAALLGARSDKVLVIDGIYEWLGKIGPVSDLLKLAQTHECLVVANEMNSFGLLGREGRGFIDFFNCYESVNIEIGSFGKYLGGFGCYIGANKFLINNIKENTVQYRKAMPKYMLAVNHEALNFLHASKKKIFQKLWQNSRYVVTRLRQLDFSTPSDTPIVVVIFSNDEEAEEFTKRLLANRIVVDQNKERVRLCISIEHTKEDLDQCLSCFESIGEDLGTIKSR
jgi:7-keto-8-aminopelargonate synthetase-like enzyme